MPALLSASHLSGPHPEPPEPLGSAPEQCPGSSEQAVHQRDTDVPPLPAVPCSSFGRGQVLQDPVQPPKDSEGGASHEKPEGLHGRRLG